jgi:phage/conjugal plasmid C-4 type zinc finger TraR family protein
MDAADEAQDHTEREVAAALTRHRAAQAAPPSTGVCVTCGEPIAQARLRVLPSARQCIGCAR